MAKIHEVHETRNTIYMISELLEGPDLAYLMLHDQRLSKNKIVKQIFRSLLTNLLDLKKNGIIHRDIKPDNIMLNFQNLGRKFEFKFLDFGLSVDLKIPGTPGNVRCGTPGYLAPEIFSTSERNFREKITFKTDIFSLGAIMHQIVYKKGIFGQDSQQGILDRNAHDVREEICYIRDQIFEEKDLLIADLVEGMLRKDLDRRYSVEECINHPYFINLEAK